MMKRFENKNWRVSTLINVCSQLEQLTLNEKKSLTSNENSSDVDRNSICQLSTELCKSIQKYADSIL
ncbi:CLUMA_CG007494, isoform A [Clunio marinus]|uniref:CLUMA_CG007494, isoform A n=1 Tax=Clunio marinus TaxID=568069 RepID=A0A1J1I0W0_9DIPT|nr:CLUMA_CG007494, isoform A [Clunio marinus]